MDSKKLEFIVETLFSIFPLLKKKLMKPEEYHGDQDLSPSHLQILFLLDDIGMQPISEIGKNLHISKPNMTPLIQKLIEKGLVQRIPSENDRRYINIGMTEKGEEFLEDLKTALADSLKKKLSSLKEDELERLAGSLHDVKEILFKID